MWRETAAWAAKVKLQFYFSEADQWTLVFDVCSVQWWIAGGSLTRRSRMNQPLFTHGRLILCSEMLCCTSAKKNSWKGPETLPTLQPLEFFFFDKMEETASITYHSSLAVSQNHFIFFPFSGKIYSSPQSGLHDVLSDCYSCVIEHVLWKGRAPSGAKSLGLWAEMPSHPSA